MAYRIQNLSKHRLALDLRGGGVVYIKPNEVSQPIREEWLYGNVHLPQWLAQGIVRRTEVKMSEVLEFERQSTPPAKPAGAAATKPATADVKEDTPKELEANDKKADTAGGDKKPPGKAKDSSAKTS